MSEQVAGAVTLDDALAHWPGARVFSFGDTEALCDDLLARVRAGRKTATCGALRDFGPGGEAMPVAGGLAIALDWHDRPALVIETVAVTVTRFCHVEAAFALAEGEDDSLAAWRAGHRAYFERNGGWSESLALVCERFRLVADLGACSAAS